MSAFLAITDAVVAALRQAPPVAADIQRGRGIPVVQPKATAARVSAVQSAAQPMDLSADTMEWKTAVVVSLYARAAAGQDGEQAIDQLLLAAWTRVQTMAMPSGVLDVVLDPRVTWDVDEADQTVVRADIGLSITHLTNGPGLAA
ncbi:MAG: hypothetical protein RL375_4126 [Pseudomonadota bacterium]|jgi:hypothetical protein